MDLNLEFELQNIGWSFEPFRGLWPTVRSFLTLIRVARLLPQRGDRREFESLKYIYFNAWLIKLFFFFVCVSEHDGG